MHNDVISDYYKTLNDGDMNHHFRLSNYQELNFVYMYIDANRIINVLCAQVKDKLSNTIKILSLDTLNYLSTNIVFSKIDEIYHPIVLYCFWTRDCNSVLEKYLLCRCSKEKKIKVLVKFLSLVSDNSDDFKMISHICNMITQIENLN
jgi:hypothetical protein